MGFTKKNAKEFFGIINKNQIEVLIDVRLNNKSQLAAFTKEEDLKFFLWQLCACAYEHELDLAPNEAILESWRKSKMKEEDWKTYTKSFVPLIKNRHIERLFEQKYLKKYNNVLLLCSEPKGEHCHRHIVAEYLKNQFPQCEIIDL